jgi:transcriptional regulator with XRE-family HTH domain
MPKSQFSAGYKAFLSVLIAARKEAGLTQTDVAERIGRKQAHISIIETGVRRLDLIEFCALARVMGYDPEVLFARVMKALPANLEI